MQGALADALPRSTSAISTVLSAHHSLHVPALTRSLQPQAAFKH
ncbi:MAG TPA: hypothetical protein VFE70_05335 [Candidatus Elarobacter sp.]|nr:hypothetical protein [Candidatus Elarobacter sp.]